MINKITPPIFDTLLIFFLKFFEKIKNIYLKQNKKITLLIEEFLVGNEASLFVVCNGKNFKLSNENNL